jgi:hypothetical protein
VTPWRAGVADVFIQLLQGFEKPPPVANQFPYRVIGVRKHALGKGRHEAVAERTHLRYAQLTEHDIEVVDDRRLEQPDHVLPAEPKSVHLLLSVAKGGSVPSKVGCAKQAALLVAEVSSLERNGTLALRCQLLGSPDDLLYIAG